MCGTAPEGAALRRQDRIRLCAAARSHQHGGPWPTHGHDQVRADYMGRPLRAIFGRSCRNGRSGDISAFMVRTPSRLRERAPMSHPIEARRCKQCGNAWYAKAGYSSLSPLPQSRVEHGRRRYCTSCGSDTVKTVRGKGFVPTVGQQVHVAAAPVVNVSYNVEGGGSVHVDDRGAFDMSSSGGGAPSHVPTWTSPVPAAPLMPAHRALPDGEHRAVSSSARWWKSPRFWFFALPLVTGGLGAASVGVEQGARGGAQGASLRHRGRSGGPGLHRRRAHWFRTCRCDGQRDRPAGRRRGWDRAGRDRHRRLDGGRPPSTGLPRRLSPGWVAHARRQVTAGGAGGAGATAATGSVPQPRRRGRRAGAGDGPRPARRTPVFDDGGLLDLNALDAAALERYAGVTVAEAASIVSTRERLVRLSSVDELVVHGELALPTAERLREYAVFIG